MNPACPTPIDSAVLADYWVEALDASEEESIEEHLLDCDGCGDRLREIIALAEGVRELARGGSLRLVVSDEFVRRAAESGSQVRRYALPAGGSVNCTVAPGDDLLVTRFAADLSGAERVDLAMCNAAGEEQYRLQDIPVKAGASGVVYQESITFGRAAPSGKLLARLFAVDSSGDDRLIGEYTFNHTAMSPNA